MNTCQRFDKAIGLDNIRNLKVLITNDICGPGYYGRISHHMLVSLSSVRYIKYYMYIN
jgi:hypothetical protein